MEKESRNGSTFDGINLCQLFKKLGFEMDVKPNLTVQQMKDAVEAVKSLCNDVDGFLLCVISVGGCGQIRGVDGEKISIDELTANFVNCPALKGKPKIFIIETCQEGNEKCPNVEPQSSGVDELEGAVKDVHISKPEPSNMIEVRCTIKGYTTARSKCGSWFVRTLIKSIIENAHQDDVVTLMKAVKHKWSNDGDMNMEITVSPDEQSSIYFHPQA
ncbi:hypothetical protein LSAT2_004761 [Lamellibrachia satsuma]|nr:hypothetical protein LSAT2_004761 [Lamellibrachia satsuma]